MINRLNFDVLPTTGMYMHNGKVIQITSVYFANETVDCFIVERDGSTKNHSNLTLQELKNIIEPFSDEPVKHKQFEKIVTLLRDGLNVYLYGAAGTGKNVLCQQIADELGLKFYCASSVKDSFEVLGFADANGRLVETEFYRAFTKGGLFMFDEMDNSSPSALTIVNSALANRYITFPVIGRVDAHPDFKIVGAGNTNGKGANELYNEREQLGAATLNRFEFVKIGYDRRIEMQITKGDNEFVDFVHDIRKSSKLTGYPFVVSYRNISSIMKLKSKFSMKDCFQMCLLKGMSKDEMGVLHRGLQNKRNRFAELLDDMYNEWDDDEDDD